MIGHQHIDPVWRWTRMKDLLRCAATFQVSVGQDEDLPRCGDGGQFGSILRKIGSSGRSADVRRDSATRAGTLESGQWMVGGIGRQLSRRRVPCAPGGCMGSIFSSNISAAPPRSVLRRILSATRESLPQDLVQTRLGLLFYLRPELNEKPDLPAPVFQWQRSGWKPTVDVFHHRGVYRQRG